MQKRSQSTSKKAMKQPTSARATPRGSWINKGAVKVYVANDDSYHINRNSKQVSTPAIAVIQKDPELPLISSVRHLHKMSTAEKMQKIESGISKKELQELKNKTGLDYEQLARIFHVTRSTLINKKGTDRFNENISEKIVSIEELYSFGYEVFGDMESFNQWIFEPNQALGNQRPIELLHSSYGREEIRNIIGRIYYGVYS